MLTNDENMKKFRKQNQSKSFKSYVKNNSLLIQNNVNVFENKLLSWNDYQHI